MTSYDEAFRQKRSNELSAWSPTSSESLAEPFAAARIHGNAAQGLAKIKGNATLQANKDSRFFCVGSCFAREIEDAIANVGLQATTKSMFQNIMAENPVHFERKHGAVGRAHAFLNRYNLGSMGDLMETIAGTQDESAALLYPAGGTEFHDYHYTRLLQQQSLETCMERRALITETYRQAAQTADIFVFTFGLCESFYDRRDGRYLNVTPDPRTAKGQDLEFRFLSLEENLQHAERIIRAVRDLNAKASILFTVSPVPLDTTFSKHDIVIANTLAKSTLLLAAHQLTERYEQCHYFPSYEMVINSAQDTAWRWDRKHVASPMVRHIMKSFIEQHIS
jgi:GSCFA family